MKQVININFHGSVIPIELTAHDTLKNYVHSLRQYFAGEEGGEEIVNDIENRIAELFHERLKNGANCITDADMDSIQASIGTVQDFVSESGSASNTQSETFEGENGDRTNTNGFTEKLRGKKLFRDENNKIIGGVCSGLAHYFVLDPVLIRVIFLVLFFTFGIGFIPYLLLWIFVPSSSKLQLGGLRKRLFRNPDNKILGGVAGGVAEYMGISVWIPRLLFLIPVLSVVFGDDTFLRWPRGYGFSLNYGPILLYIIAWIIIPEAKTTSEKLEMRGQKVDLDTISNSVKEEITGAGKRISAAASRFGNGVNNANNRSGLSKTLRLILKVLVYIIMGSILVSLFLGLLSGNIAAIAAVPYKDFLLSTPLQNTMFWVSIVLVLALPVIAIIIAVIRRLAGYRSKNAAWRVVPVVLWVIGLFALFSLIGSVAKDFVQISNSQEEKIMLQNPSVNKLIISPSNNQNTIRQRWKNSWDGFQLGNEDTVELNNIVVNVLRAKDSLFNVSLEKVATGATTGNADASAALIDFNVQQQDSFLLAPNTITINKTDKFRNQAVVLNIYVPVGKQIMIDRTFTDNGRNLFVNFNDKVLERDNAMNWRAGETLVMQYDGLYTLDGEKVVSSKKYNRNSPRKNKGLNIRSRRNNPNRSNEERDIQMLEEMKKEINNELKDINTKVKPELKDLPAVFIFPALVQPVPLN